MSGYSDHEDAQAADRQERRALLAASLKVRARTVLRHPATWVIPAVALVMIGLVVFLGGPAKAAEFHAASGKSKSFAWSFTGKCCHDLHKWTSTRRGPVSISGSVVVADTGGVCATEDGPTQFRIILYRHAWYGLHMVGHRDLTCSGVAHWDSVTADTYSARVVILYPWRDSETFDASGRVKYGVR